MGKLREKMVGKEKLFVGIDLHKQRCQVTIRTLDTEVVRASIPWTGSILTCCNTAPGPDAFCSSADWPITRAKT